jgi:hypothetical protein
VFQHGSTPNDFPGTVLDTNKICNETGKSAYRDCDQIILLRKYELSKSNKTLTDCLVKCIGDGKNVALVIAHIDSFSSGDKLVDEQRFDEELKILKKRPKEAKDVEDAEESKEPDEGEWCDTLESTKISHAIYLRRLAVRKQAITKEMQDLVRGLQVKYTGREGAKLPVHCIFSKDHECYVDGFRLNKKRPS